MNHSQRAAIRRKEILSRFTSNNSVKEVAQILNTHYQTIWLDFKALGWPRNDPYKQKGNNSKNKKDHSLLLLAVSKNPLRSLQSFGDQFNISRERVRQILKKHNIIKPKSLFDRLHKTQSLAQFVEKIDLIKKENTLLRKYLHKSFVLLLELTNEGIFIEGIEDPAEILMNYAGETHCESEDIDWVKMVALLKDE